MLKKVFYTSVLVSDQDRALDFYTNVLGLENRVENPTPDGPRFLTVGVQGDEFQLVLWPGTPGQAEPAMGRPPASMTIETDDCRKTVEELQVARRRVRLRRARVPVGLRRAVPGPRRQPAADPRGPLARGTGASDGARPVGRALRAAVPERRGRADVARRAADHQAVAPGRADPAVARSLHTDRSRRSSVSVTVARCPGSSCTLRKALSTFGGSPAPGGKPT